MAEHVTVDARSEHPRQMLEVRSTGPALPFEARLVAAPWSSAEGVVELLASSGHHSMISLNRDAFAIELPGGADPIWPDRVTS